MNCDTEKSKAPQFKRGLYFHTGADGRTWTGDLLITNFIMGWLGGVVQYQQIPILRDFRF